MSVIDDYLKKLDPAQRAELERVRQVVKQIVPGAEETIGYGMPVFKHNKKYLIGMSGFKNHMSIFPGAGPIAELQDKLGKYKTSKGTIQFTLDNPLPNSLLKEIVVQCQKLNS